MGKLPKGLVELYTSINIHAEALSISYLVVGAMARDLVLVHGYGSRIERGTKDVDFAIDVPDWDKFMALKNRLISDGYSEDPKSMQRVIFQDSDGIPWEIDIVPFGEIANAEAKIDWPPNQDTVMTVLGFKEAHENSLQIQIGEYPDVIIPVASPTGICILKLVAWLDRDSNIRRKDATDFRYIIESYTKIPSIFDAVYDDGCMEAQGWDESKASAMKLGLDVAKIALPSTRKFLENELFGRQVKVEQLAREMASEDTTSLAECSEWLGIFQEAFESGHPQIAPK